MVHARHRAAVETETLADGTDGLDADDGLDGGVVFGTGSHHHLHILDLVAAQLVEFALVAHLPSVDVDERSATAQHFHATMVADDAGNLAQNVARCSCLGKITALNGGHECVILHFHQRT